MSHWKLLCCLFFFGFSTLQAQSTYTLSGTVRLPSGTLPSGNMILLHAKDSSLIQGSFFVDGALFMKQVPREMLLLQLTSLEFRDTIITLLTTDQEQYDLGEIIVSSDELYLDEVVVKNRRPTYVQKSNGSVEVIIENTILASSNSTEEILAKSPEITIDEEEGISVFGKGAAIIFLNDQRITSHQLALVAPANIRSIEIIRNPSAKYDAEGGAVILIHTLQPLEDDLQLSLKQNIDYSPFAGWKTFSQTNLNLRRGKFLARAFASFAQGKDKFFKGTTRDRSPEDIFISSDLATDWLPHQDYDWRYGVGTQWLLDQRSYVSLEYSGFLQAVSGLISSNNTIQTEQLLGQYDVDIERDEKDRNHSLSLNLKKQLDTTGTSLFIGGQFSEFYGNDNNPITEISIENGENTSRNLFNQENRDILILSGQADYTQIINNRITAEAGLKYAYVKNQSNADFLVAKPSAGFELDPNLSNLFGYREQVAAGYLQWIQRLNSKWDYRLGLRTELTAFNLEVQEATNNISDRYLNFFPSASITYQASDAYQFNLAYSSSINRQDYNRLNPGLIYQDPYTSIQGNPFLLPEKVQSLELTSQLNRTTVKFGYSYTEHPFAGAAIPGDDEQSYILIRLNLDLQHLYYASISRNIETKYWSSSTTVSQYYSKGEELAVGLQGKSPIPHWYVYSVNRFKVGRLFNLEALVWWHNAFRDGTINRTPAWNLTLSLEKSFFDQDLTLRLIANDLFHSQRADGDYRAGVTDITFRNKWNSNYFRLALSYNFGNLQRQFSHRAISKDSERRVR